MNETITETNQSPRMPIYGSPNSEPDVPALIHQFKRCTPWSNSGWNRIRHNDDVRFCRWPGQSTDCKKHGLDNEPAFPWEGASDQRVYDADDLVNTDVAECFEAFMRAWVSPKAGLSTVHSYAVKLAEHIVNVWLEAEISREVELSASYRSHYGWVVLHHRWEREFSLEYRDIDLETITAAAQALGAALESPQRQQVLEQYPMAEQVAALPSLILDPEEEELAAQYLRSAWEVYSRDAIGEVLDLPELPLEYLRAAVRELRENGQAQMPVPYLCRNQPACYALKPFEEIFVPPYCTDIQRGPIFQRDFLSEQELRAKQLNEGWAPKWVDEAVKHKGKVSNWLHTSQTATGTPPTTLGEAISSSGIEYYTEEQTPTDLVEVVYCTYRMIDPQGVPGIYMTIVHPLVGTGPDSKGPKYAWHGLLGNAKGKLPYVQGTRENWSRAIVASRGIPEIANSSQRVVKANTDAAIDWTSIAVNPPRHVISGIKLDYKFGPGEENLVQLGREPKFADIPVKGVPLAYQLLELSERRSDRYFGRDNATLPPGHGQPKRQMKVSSFLVMWAAAVQGMIDDCQANMPDPEFAEITGAPTGWLEENRRSRGLLSAKLQFDIRELDPEYVATMLKVVNEAIIPQDVAGITDRAKWTRAQWQMINPRLGRELVSDTAGASEKTFLQVRDEVGQMFIGNEARYTENDPAAKAKLQFLQQILGANPYYKQAIGADNRFMQLVQRYAQNLQQSIKQEQNKVVGRIGVMPESPETQGAMQ